MSDIVSGIGDAIGGAVDAVGGAIGDIASGVGDIVEGALDNPLTTAALLGAGFFFAPEIGAWLAADGTTVAAADAAAADAAAGITAADTAANVAAATAADTAAGLGEFAGVDAATAANAAAAAAAPMASTEAVLAAADPGLLSSLGLGGLSAGQIAGMVGAGLLAPTVLSALGLGGKAPAAGAGTGGTFTAPHVDIPKLTQGGVNPGMLPIKPAYATTNDVQSQFSWAPKPYVASATDLAALQNQTPSTTAHGWGLQQAQQPFDVNAFIAKNINPAAAAALAGAPFPAPATAPVAPVAPTQA